MTRKLLMLTAAITGITMLTAAAGADTNTWDGSASTSWNNDDNWSLDHKPTSTEDVVIASPGINNPTLNEAATVQSLTIQNTGLLTIGAFTLTVTGGDVHIQNGGKIDMTHCSGKLVVSDEDGLDIESTGVLELDGELELVATSTTTGHDIDGQILLQNSCALIDVQESMWFIGDGEVEGQHADANITIASEKTLSNKMSATSGDGFTGFMTIDGGGKFDNLGRVEASGGGVLNINCGEVDDVDSGDFWVVASSSSTLKFSVAPNDLAGDFVLSGKLDLTANSVLTCGGLTYNTNAVIDVTSTTFKYQDFDGGTCSGGNPKDSGTGANCGALIWVVSTDKDCT